MGVNHRILYPRSSVKSGWTAFPADGKPHWEHEKKLGILDPETPAALTASGVENKPSGNNEKVRVDNYVLLGGEIVLGITLHAYLGVGTGGKVTLKLEAGSLGTFSSNFAASAAAWRTITHAGALTQGQIEELAAVAEASVTATTFDVLDAWYIDLETETAEAEVVDGATLLRDSPLYACALADGPANPV
jgi:hypothetical protein